MQISAITNKIFSYNDYRSKQLKAKPLPLYNQDVFIKTGSISFQSATTSAGNVLKKLRKIPCPYYGCTMIAGSDMTKIEKRLDTCADLADSVKILLRYSGNMQKTEKAVFDKLKLYAKENPNILVQECLQKWYDEALTKLKLEEFSVLDKVDKISQNLSPKTALELRDKTTRCRQVILTNDQEDTFKRKTFLNSLDEIVPLPEEQDTFEKMKDQALYLPTSGSSENAFIVKYASRTQQEITKRILRASVATIEHIKPNSLGGANSLENFILVSAAANSNRSNMPLAKFIERHPEVVKNCQKYINRIIELINHRDFVGFETYPYQIQQTLFAESEGRIQLDLSKYDFTEEEAKKTIKKLCTQKKYLRLFYPKSRKQQQSSGYQPCDLLVKA